MSVGPGSRLGPYEILSAIGAGGMGDAVSRRSSKRDLHNPIRPVLGR